MPSTGPLESVAVRRQRAVSDVLEDWLGEAIPRWLIERMALRVVEAEDAVEVVG